MVRMVRCCFLSLLAMVVTGCPPATTVEGEGEGEIAGEGEGDTAGEGEGEEGEGDAAGEGEGEGEPEPDAPVVVGTNFVFLETSRISGDAAFRDRTTLMVLPRNDVVAATVATNVDRVVFSGDSLVAFHGVVGNVAATAEVRRGSAATVELGTNIKISTLDASDDGQHLFWEQVADVAAGTENLLLNGNVVMSGTRKAKNRFTADNAYLVVGANLSTDVGTDKTVRTFALTDGAETVLAIDDTSNETAVTRSGATVLYGDRENGNVVDITLQPALGGEPLVLAEGADDVSFKMTPGDTELVYLVDTTTSGAIEAVGLQGDGRRRIRAPGGVVAIDLVAVSTGHVVYATSETDDLESLGIISMLGANDTPLGDSAVAKGFTADGRFCVFLDNVVAGVGRLQTYDTSNNSIVTLAAGVTKVAVANDNQVVALGADGVLSVVTLATAASVVIDGGVNGFGLVRDVPNGAASWVAYGNAAGIWRKRF